MTELIAYLKQSDVFYQFTHTQLELVTNLCQEKVFSDGEVIFEENNNSKQLYIIAQGEVEILIDSGTFNSDDKSEKISIATLHRGQSFGEIEKLIEQLATQMKEIRLETERMSSGSQKIVSSVSDINIISKETASQTQTVSAATEEQSASMEEIAGSSEALSKLAQDLQAAVQRFKV